MQFGSSSVIRNGRPVPNRYAIMQAGNLFVFAINNPIRWIDPSGLRIELPSDTTQEQRDAYNRAITYLNRSEVFRGLWQTLEDATEVFTIAFTYNHFMRFDHETRTIFWDTTSGLIMLDGAAIQSAALGLAHEMGHAAQYLEGHAFFDDMTQDNRALLEAENLRRFESPIARQLGEPTRARYFDDAGVHRMNNSTHHRIIYTPNWNSRSPFAGNSRIPMTIDINWRR